GYSWWTKWRKPIAAIAVAAITMGATTWAMGAYALEIGSSTGFATLAGATETGTVITGFGNATAAVASGFASGGISGGNMESAVAGAISAGLFYGAGSLADAAVANGASGFGSGGLGRVALHAAVGCASGAAAGGSCRQQAAGAGFAELAGPVVSLGDNNVAYGIVAHAVAGGIGAKLAGGKFENGAVTGAFGYLFNEMGHCYQRGYCSREEHIRQRAAHCDGSIQCAREVIAEATESSLPGFRVDLWSALKDFTSIGTLPLELTPTGRAISTGAAVVGAASDYYTGNVREGNAATAGIVTGSIYESAALGFGREFAGRFGVIAGKLAEWIWFRQTEPSPR
ncbi:MAG TPA: hypothetical protein PLF26_20310, partial [Blastocatellia bacterium]|nr:hypothetical protein [Blastocatellia bacterium]